MLGALRTQPMRHAIAQLDEASRAVSRIDVEKAGGDWSNGQARQAMASIDEASSEIRTASAQELEAAHKPVVDKLDAIGDRVGEVSTQLQAHGYRPYSTSEAATITASDVRQLHGSLLHARKGLSELQGPIDAASPFKEGVKMGALVTGILGGAVGVVFGGGALLAEG